MKSRIDKTEYSFFINEYNNKFWYKNGQSHRDKDLPAMVYSDGDMAWFKNGLSHRENNLPAIIYSDGRLCWYIDGELIRKIKK